MFPESWYFKLRPRKQILLGELDSPKEYLWRFKISKSLYSGHERATIASTHGTFCAASSARH